MCDHPLAERTVVGNPDPYDRRDDAMFDSIKFDATCEVCGENVPVYYRFDPEASHG